MHSRRVRNDSVRVAGLVLQLPLVVREECLNPKQTAGFAAAPSIRYRRLSGALG
jgi:hypothetical protein